MTVHAERNAISMCAKLGIRTEGCHLVCTHRPCSVCAGIIIQSGIKKVIVKAPKKDFLDRWDDDTKIGKDMLNEAGVEYIEMD